MQLVHEAILKYLMSQSSDETYVDFVVVGNHGADFSSHSDKRYIGKVAEGVIKNSHLNSLFVP